MSHELIDQYTEGDTAPDLVRAAPPSIPDLTGFTVRLRIARADGIDLEKEITEIAGSDGHIDDPTEGAFFFTFLATDLVAGGLQRSEIEFDDGSGGITTQSDLFFTVNRALG